MALEPAVVRLEPGSETSRALAWARRPEPLMELEPVLDWETARA